MTAGAIGFSPVGRLLELDVAVGGDVGHQQDIAHFPTLAHEGEGVLVAGFAEGCNLSFLAAPEHYHDL